MYDVYRRLGRVPRAERALADVPAARTTGSCPERPTRADTAAQTANDSLPTRQTPGAGALTEFWSGTATSASGQPAVPPLVATP